LFDCQITDLIEVGIAACHLMKKEDSIVFKLVDYNYLMGWYSMVCSQVLSRGFLSMPPPRRAYYRYSNIA